MSEPIALPEKLIEYNHITYLADQRDNEREFPFFWFIAKQQPADSYLYEVARKMAIIWDNKTNLGCGYSGLVEKKLKEHIARLYA